MILKILIAAMLALIVFVLYVIVSDLKRRKRSTPQKTKKTRRIEPKVTKRKPKTTTRISDTPTTEPTEERRQENVRPDTEPRRRTTDRRPTEEESVQPQTPPPIWLQSFRWTIKIPQRLPRPHITYESLTLYGDDTRQPTQELTLPQDDYPPFSHQRLLEMGLNEEDAREFIQELVPQIEEQIPQIEAALDKEDFHQMERLTHSIKGSSTNIGTGGVADVLVDYNTYLKTGQDKAIAARYLDILKKALERLKKHYGVS